MMCKIDLLSKSTGGSYTLHLQNSPTASRRVRARAANFMMTVWVEEDKSYSVRMSARHCYM